MDTHRIPSHTPTIGHNVDGHFTADADIAFPNGRRHYVGGWDATGTGRVVFQGPMVAGPHAYAGPAARVLAAVRIADRPVVTVKPGDVIQIAGCSFAVSRDQRARFARGDCEIALTPVAS